MIKRVGIILLLLFAAGRVQAEELRIVTFDYPPYTSLETQGGLVERLVNRAMASRSIKVRWDYFPLARAFQEFLADSEAVFAGNIGQFSETDQRGLRSVVTMTTREYLVARTDQEGQSLENKIFVGLRNDNKLIAGAKKYNGSFEVVNAMSQAFEMVSLGRADVIFCLDQEIEELKKYPNLMVLGEHTSTLELQLVYHEASRAGEILSRVARETHDFSR